METLMCLIFALVMILIALALCVRFILPRDVWSDVLAAIIHDGLKGIWHLIFGPERVRVVGDKKTRILGIQDKARSKGPI